MLYEFKLGHNAAEESKNICCAKSKETADDSIGSWWLKKFLSGFMNLHQIRSGRNKSVDSEAVLQVIDPNLACRIQGVSGEFSIFSVVHQLPNLSKSGEIAL